MLRVESIVAAIHEIPLREPFATAQDRAPRTVARLVRLQVVLSDGRSVISEAVPAPYVTGETCETLVQDIEAAAPHFIGLDGTRLRPMLAAAHYAVPAYHHTARAALEVAAYRTYSLATGADLWRHFGGALESIDTDITISRTADPVKAAEVAAHAGFRRVKVKAGDPPHQEVERLAEMHAAAPSLTFRLDANQAYTVQEALDLATQIAAAQLPVEFLEQPVKWDDYDALARVAEASPIPIVADEAVKTPEDALNLVATTRVHAINIKVMKSGVTGALGILAIVQAAGRKAMIGCMLESSSGIGFSAALACGTGAFTYVDLDSHLLLNEPQDNPWFVQQGSTLVLAHTHRAGDGA